MEDISNTGNNYLERYLDKKKVELNIANRQDWVHELEKDQAISLETSLRPKDGCYWIPSRSEFILYGVWGGNLEFVQMYE